MITKFDKFLSEENMVDTILDKIKEKGIDNITPLEKEYLDNTSKKQDNRKIEKELKGEIIRDDVGIYIFKFEAEEYTDDEIIGNITISGDDDVYHGSIHLDDEKEFKLADFNSVINIDKTIYDEYEDIVYEMDSFFDFVVYKLLHEEL